MGDKMVRILGLFIAVLLGMTLAHFVTSDWYRKRFDKKAYYQEKDNDRRRWERPKKVNIKKIV